MANKFTVGMRNLVEVLNQMWDAFAAGPYNGLPLTGGTVNGDVGTTERLIAIAKGSSAGGSNVTTAIQGPINQRGTAPSLVMSLGVGGTNGLSFGGRYQWYTSSGRDVGNGNTFFAASYDLRVRTIDTQSNSEGEDIFVLSGGGNLAVRGNISHLVDNANSFGKPATRASTVYAATGAINTSDARLKTLLRPMSAGELATALELAESIGVYRWLEAVEEKSGDAREHIGLTVQAAISIMESHGLDPFNYGFICHDEWARQVIEHPAAPASPAIPATAAVIEVRGDDGKITQAAAPATPGHPAIAAREAYTEVLIEAGDRYGFRYDELLLFIARGQAARQAALEQRIAALESAL